MRPKLNKSFPTFRFDSRFNIHLVLPRGFKITNVKNRHSENIKHKLNYCNVNIFNSLTSVIAQCRTSNFIFWKIDWTVCLCILYFPAYLPRFSSCMQKFQWEKKVSANHWNFLSEQKSPLKKVLCTNRYSPKQLFCRVPIWNSGQNLWKVPMKKFNFSKFAGLWVTILISSEHFHWHILIRLALMHSSYFVKDPLPGASNCIKTDTLFNTMIKERCEILPLK